MNRRCHQFSPHTDDWPKGGMMSQIRRQWDDILILYYASFSSRMFYQTPRCLPRFTLEDSLTFYTFPRTLYNRVVHRSTFLRLDLLYLQLVASLEYTNLPLAQSHLLPRISIAWLATPIELQLVKTRTHSLCVTLAANCQPHCFEFSFASLSCLSIVCEWNPTSHRIWFWSALCFQTNSTLANSCHLIALSILLLLSLACILFVCEWYLFSQNLIPIITLSLDQQCLGKITLPTYCSDFLCPLPTFHGYVRYV